MGSQAIKICRLTCIIGRYIVSRSKYVSGCRSTAQFLVIAVAAVVVVTAVVVVVVPADYEDCKF